MKTVKSGIKKSLIVMAVILVALGVASFGWLALQTDASRESGDPRTGERPIRIVGYNHIEDGGIACAAIMPACGTCYGEVIDKECYVTQEEFDSFKELYPELRGEPVN